MPRLLSYALRSIWARRINSLATAGGIALLAFVLAASGMLALGMRFTMMSTGSASRALVMQQDQWSEYGSRLPQPVLTRAAASPHVKRGPQGQPLVAGETVSHLMLASASNEARYSTLQVRGIDSNVFELRPNVRVVKGRAIRPGAPEAMVGRGVADRFAGLNVGSSFELAVGRPVHVVGVFESGGSAYESEVWADIETARSSLGMAGYYSSITAELEGPSQFDDFAASFTGDKQMGIVVERESSYYRRISSGLADVVDLLGTAQALIISLGAALGTMIVAYTSVVQRRQEIGVLRALGFRRRSILAALLTESVALALAGGAAGVLLVLPTLLFDFNTVNVATNQEVAFRFIANAEALLRSMAAAAAVGLVGGLWPALRAARMDPVQAMRS